MTVLFVETHCMRLKWKCTWCVAHRDAMPCGVQETHAMRLYIHTDAMNAYYT